MESITVLYDPLPLLFPMAKNAFHYLSTHREDISKLFGLKPEQEIKKVLGQVRIDSCEIAEQRV